jgi:hypothetical protein
VGKAYLKNSLIAGVAASMVALTLTGCGGDKTSEVTAVSIDKDGHVSNVIYEQFDKDYYDLEELSKMAEDELEEYNSEYLTPKITLDKVESVEDGDYVRVSMNYDSASDYSNFNEETLFYGTIEEAEAAGYKVSDGLVDSKGEKIDSSFAADHPERHIIITNDKSNIIAPFNIEYTTKGVSLVGKKEAKLADATAESIQLLLSK